MYVGVLATYTVQLLNSCGYILMFRVTGLSSVMYSVSQKYVENTLSSFAGGCPLGVKYEKGKCLRFKVKISGQLFYL
jgi:hypothetical protein